MNTTKVATICIVLILNFGCKAQSEHPNFDSGEEPSSLVEAQKISQDIFSLGKAYPKSTQFGKFGKFQTYEIYTDAASGKEIVGVEKFGPFRLYTTQEFDVDSCYRGLPRVEFIDTSGEVIKTVIPSDILTMFQNHKIEMTPTTGMGLNNFEIVNKDSSLANIDLSEEKGDYLNSSKLFVRFEYDIEGHNLLITARYNVAEDMAYLIQGYEVMVFDTVGNLTGRTSGYGSLNIVDATLNGRFLYLNSGGQISPDQRLKYQFKIVDLKTNQIVYAREEVGDEKIVGFTIVNTNLGAFTVEALNTIPNTMKEAYVIDHDENKIYSIHKNKFCSPGIFINFYEEYCECIDSHSNRVKQYYKNDFPVEKLND